VPNSAAGQSGSRLEGRPSEAPRFHQRGEESRANHCNLVQHRSCLLLKAPAFANNAKGWATRRTYRQERLYDAILSTLTERSVAQRRRLAFSARACLGIRTWPWRQNRR